jgi:hypothetical protein
VCMICNMICLVSEALMYGFRKSKINDTFRKIRRRFIDSENSKQPFFDIAL